jgi:hypothetical protein
LGYGKRGVRRTQENCSTGRRGRNGHLPGGVGRLQSDRRGRVSRKCPAWETHRRQTFPGGVWGIRRYGFLSGVASGGRNRQVQPGAIPIATSSSNRHLHGSRKSARGFWKPGAVARVHAGRFRWQRLHLPPLSPGTCDFYLACMTNRSPGTNHLAAGAMVTPALQGRPSNDRSTGRYTRDAGANRGSA